METIEQVHHSVSAIGRRMLGTKQNYNNDDNDAQELHGRVTRVQIELLKSLYS